MTGAAPLEIGNDQLRLRVLPRLGGGIASFDWIGQGDGVPLMRPWMAGGAEDPNRLACYPLLPWSNRVAHGGFFYGGRRVALERNRVDDAWPIHGHGWQREWTVANHEGQVLVLTMEETSPEGYSYRALLGYRLDGDALRVRLRVMNTGPASLPFGLGLHPFFPLHNGARLHAPATSVWLNDGSSPLPVECAALPEAWDFSRPRGLPVGGLNHAFQGWAGHATIEWPAVGLRLGIQADLDTYVLYVPPGEAFFCFEPVDHPINAFHLDGGPIANGMTDLAPGTSIERSFAFQVETLHGRKF